MTRNALKYAGSGRITLRAVSVAGRAGIEIIVEDHGPGIKNLDLALEGGHSTGGGLGLGVSGSKRLMDDFHIETSPARYIGRDEKMVTLSGGMKVAVAARAASLE